MQIINPATEKVIKEIREDSPDELLRKFKILKEGQRVWSRVSLKDRIAILEKFNGLLLENIESLAMILTSEVGKPLQQARNEVNGARTRIDWLLKNASKYLDVEIMTDDQNIREKIVYEPLGVICNISAWNYPLLVGVNVYIPALVAGNSVMYKPSEYATCTGLEIQRLLYHAGVPEEVFQLAIGAKDVGETLLDFPFNGYFFTGSYRTGKYIYERVASKMVPCQCELGGKDPLYIADDVADVKAVANATADGAFYNNGQSCCAVERIYVHEKIYDAYVDEFVREVRSWKIGSPLEPGVYIGPLTRKEQLNTLEQQVKEAVTGGAVVLAGGTRLEREGYYFAPTVLVNVNNRMTVMQEESFGPIIGIMKVGSDDEAVEKMADTKYGLTAGVYSASKERAEKIISQLDTGTGYWNCCDRVSPAVPWSGRNQSGIGATLSHQGLRAFTKPKAYHLRS